MTLHKKLISRSSKSSLTQLSAANILLVDDYPANILISGTYLECLGLKYDVAVNGLEAVQLVTKTQYTVILMDINMPVMDGITATAAIRKLEKDTFRLRQPIIALTAHPEFLEDDKAKILDMDAVIMKPFPLEKLESVLRKYMEF